MTQQRPAHHLPPAALTPWSDAVCELYRLRERFDAADLGAVLDVARDVSKSVARPAAPVTTFLLGFALARTIDDDEHGAATLGAHLARLAREVQDAALAVPDAGPAASEPGPGSGAPA